MKKICFFVLLLGCAGWSRAQITLTAASFPNVGDSYVNLNDSLPSISLGSAGANQTWDLTMLNNQYSDTTNVVSVGSTPNGALFPTANLAARQGAGYVYLNKTASEVDIIGASADPGIGVVLNIPYISPQILAKDGITYNSTYNFTSQLMATVPGSLVGFPVDSFRLTQTTYTVKTADGWGTVSTPINAHPCLRLKQRDSTITVIDALFLGSWSNFNTSTSIGVSYDYVDNTTIEPIATLTMDSTSNHVKSTAYRYEWPTGVASVNRATLFNVYPNPGNSQDAHLLVGGLKSNHYTLCIFSMDGRQLFANDYFIQQTAVTEVNLGALQLPGGNYVASILEDGKPIQSMQFSMVR